MAKESTAALVARIARPMAEALELKLWDVTFEKEGACWFLRVFLDGTRGPVTIDQCEKLSRMLSDWLDEEDPIAQSYYLEVSSAGLGRRLKKQEHLKAFLGHSVSLRLIRPREGRRDFSGELSSVGAGGKFFLDSQGRQHEFCLAECAYVKLDDDLNLFE